MRALLLIAAPVLATAAGAPQAVDLLHVESRAAAAALARDGTLVAIHAFPAEFGGPSDEENIVYVPPGAIAARTALLALFRERIAEAHFDTMTVVPRYVGRSVIPVAITMTARHSRKSGSFTRTIRIW